MIELLKNFPDNVTAFALHGKVIKADYDTVLIPDLEGKLGRHKRVRLYCQIAPDYVGVDPGAVWEDTEFGFSHLFDLGPRRDGHRRGMDETGGVVLRWRWRVPRD
jgi:hypothetical protein